MVSDSTRSSIFIVGGISSNDTTLCEDAFWQYNYHTNTWTQWSSFNSIARRAGHAAVIHKDVLLIVGGYGNQADTKLEHFITAINLDSKVVQKYELVRR